MKHGLVMSLCAAALVACGVERALAQPATSVVLSLDLFYNDAATTTSAGSWQLLATATHEGLAGLDTQLTGVNVGSEVFAAPTGFELTYLDDQGTPDPLDDVQKPWNTNQDANAATLDMLFGQVPKATGTTQTLNYDLGTVGATGADANPDELGVTVAPPALANAVLLAFGTFAANSTPAIVVGQTQANVFTAEGTMTTPPGINTIDQADVTLRTRNNITSLPGDANLDKSVTLADLTILGTFFGQNDKIYQQGDFNGDKSVTLGDLTILGTFFGQSAPPNAAAVPEPSTFVLLGAAVVGLGCLRRRRR